MKKKQIKELMEKVKTTQASQVKDELQLKDLKHSVDFISKKIHEC